MRITNNYIRRNALARVQSNLSAIAAAQEQASSGKKLLRASDDPAAANRAMATRSSMRALEQYQSNVDDAKSKARTEGTVLDQLGDVLTRAKELAVTQNGATADADTRKAAAIEVEQLVKQAVALGNTKYGDQYLFGGEHADSAPLNDAGTLTSAITQTPKTEIGAGRKMSANHNAKEIFIDPGTIDALSHLATALKTNDVAGISTAMGEIDDAFDETQVLVGETGARVNQLDMAASNLAAFGINLEALSSKLEDVDLEKTLLELTSRTTAYQAAMLATSHVLGLTLADYL